MARPVVEVEHLSKHSRVLNRREGLWDILAYSREPVHGDRILINDEEA